MFWHCYRDQIFASADMRNKMFNCQTVINVDYGFWIWQPIWFTTWFCLFWFYTSFSQLLKGFLMSYCLHKNPPLTLYQVLQVRVSGCFLFIVWTSIVTATPFVGYKFTARLTAPLSPQYFIRWSITNLHSWLESGIASGSEVCFLRTQHKTFLFGLHYDNY